MEGSIKLEGSLRLMITLESKKKARSGGKKKTPHSITKKKHTPKHFIWIEEGKQGVDLFLSREHILQTDIKSAF